jgi:D-alanyl-D-alanine carboxypeptidase (penicillin-binding protein 5/6)
LQFMNRSGRLAFASLIPLLLLVFASPCTATTDPYPGTARSYLLVLDDKPLWQREPLLTLQPASLTKLLTALVVLDSHWDPDRWLTVSASAAATPPTRVGLRTGEQVTAGAVLAAMLIRSANDACRVLMESVTTDINSFRTRLNARAAALGMKHSKFVDPCGFDAPQQQSTVTDLLKLAQAAQAVPLIAALVVMPQAELITRRGRSIRFVNTNQLLGRLEGTAGMKTGYTSQAGQCLIAYVRRPGHDVWLVMLGGTKRWWQAHGMINDAFATVTAR